MTMHLTKSPSRPVIRIPLLVASVLAVLVPAAPAAAVGTISDVAVVSNGTATPLVNSTFSVGTISGSFAVNIRFTNNSGGNVVLDATPVMINNQRFSITATNCNATVSLASNDYCDVALFFTPNGDGPFSGLLTLMYSSGAPNSTAVTISGTVSTGGGGGGGGGGVSPNYIQQPVATGLGVSGDGLSITITPSTARPIVFCPVSATALSQCVGPNIPANERYRYVYFPQSAVSSMPLNSSVNVFGGQPSTIADGTYNVFVDNSTANGGTIVGYGPLTVAVANGVGSGSSLDTAPAPAVFPAINATGQPALSGVVNGSTAKCVAPGFDVTPTAVDMVLSVDGVQLKSVSVTTAPFETSATVPAGSTGKTVTCSITARSSGGSLTIGSDAVVTATAVKPVTPTTPTTPITSCSGTRVIGFGNAATSLSASGKAAAASFGASACKYTVTGYSQPSSSRASALAAARANAVAAAIKAANPNAVVSVVNGGKTKNASCAKVSNRCVVVSRG